jgi:NAD(P)H-nitrite reductase large subunit
MRIVVIGNSAAAVGAVESLRQYDQRAEILVISEEPHLIYSRPLLSHYLGGEIDRARLAFRPSNFYSRHNVQPLLNARVTAIDTASHTVKVAAGSQSSGDAAPSYTYDKLLISTGGLPIVPPIPGLGAGGVYTFTRLDDAQAVVQDLEEHRPEHAVVVGGGMIGIKAVEGLTRRHIAVTVVELAPRILTAALDQTACDLLTKLLNEHGVSVLTENTVTEVLADEQGEPGAGGTGRPRVGGIALKDGRRLPCDLLIFGIGVRPNASLAQEAGIRVNRGIVVDEFMRTSASDVYAAGDVAEAYDLVVDMNRVVAIWPNAYRQGAIAAAHMAGIARPDPGGIPMNTVDVCGVPAMSIGNANVDPAGPLPSGRQPYEIMIQLDEKSYRYKRLVLQGDYLVGAILVGNVNRAGVYTGLIRNKINVASCRKTLMSDDLSLLSLPDQYRKHIVTGAGIEV